ncbi:MAG: hypothetical protein OXU77_19845 [Gammaproteobacteria bacterium]|nr:hypothetical protein [Gammaproteobacteria bacterium]MDE0442500.1 hypothetical protein [Gammaproteobacteria bacterium]
MATPRKKLVDPENACAYHLVSKCTRGMFLCGWDKSTRKQYGHRRRWLVKRARSLAECFAVDLLTYAVMSNHFHLVVIFDPKACETWSDEDVARRWIDAFPPPKPRSRARGRIATALIWERRKADRRELLLSNPARLERARRTLGSLSSFMKHLKQPIARRANLEDGCEGHFFQQRFYSGALLNEKAIIAASAYVDLNAVRANLAKTIEEYEDVSIAERVREDNPERLADYLRPIASGLGQRMSFVEITLGDYVGLLEGMAAALTAPETKTAQSDPITDWRARVFALSKRQRAYGSAEQIKAWTNARGLRCLEKPLPV